MKRNNEDQVALAAAFEVDHDKYDLIPKMAAALRSMRQDVEERDAAAQRLTDGEAAYAKLRQAALKAGWTAAKLAKLGYRPVPNLPHNQQRRRRSPATTTPATPASVETAEVTAVSDDARTPVEPTPATASTDPLFTAPAAAADRTRHQPTIRQRTPEQVRREPHDDEGLWPVDPPTATANDLPDPWPPRPALPRSASPRPPGSL